MLVLLAVVMGLLGLVGFRQYRDGAELTMLGVFAPVLLLGSLALLFLVFIVPNV